MPEPRGGRRGEAFCVAAQLLFVERCCAKVVEPWKVNPNSVNYTWPWVHSYCVPCKEKKVGTCFMSGCYDWRGPTECHLTRCVCAEGFCADENAAQGQEVCKPQVCKEGPRPLPFVPGFPVHLFYWLGGENAFPKGHMTQTRMIDYLVGVVLSHSWLLGFGILVIFLTIVAHWKYKAPYRKTMEVVDSMKIVDSMPTDEQLRRLTESARTVECAESPEGEECLEAAQKGDSVRLIEDIMDDDSKGHRRVYRRPRARALMFWVVLLVLLIVSVVVVRDRNWRETMSRVHSLLDMMMSNAKRLKRLGRRVDKKCIELEASMTALARECRHDPMVAMIDDETLNTTRQYMTTVHQLHLLLRELPGMVASAEDLIQENELMAFWIPLMPVLVVALITCVMICEAIVVAFVGKIKLVVLLDMSLRLAVVPYSVLILTIAVLSLISFTMASLFSSFCMEVDDNVLTLVNTFTRKRNLSEVYEICEFYLKGSGTMNPASRYAKVALQEIDLIYDVYLQFQPMVDAYKITCPVLEHVKIEEIAQEAKQILRHCSLMLEPANLYPFYQQMVREALCRDLMSSLASFPIFTVVSGLVIYPLSAFFTHRFLVRWVHWKIHTEQTEGRDKRLDELLHSYDSTESASDSD